MPEEQSGITPSGSAGTSPDSQGPELGPYRLIDEIGRGVDGGTTSDGLPYLVMELVDGQPIDRYCADRRLSVEERLALFLEVCSAGGRKTTKVALPESPKEAPLATSTCS